MISVVIPMKDEAGGIDALFSVLLPIMDALKRPYEIVVVNDGSRDETLAKLLAYQGKIKQLVILDLSRNFGKEAALTAGFAHAKGDAVITLDADLQDSPELISEMVQKWEEGYEVVTVVRKHRQEDTWLHRQNVKLFYKIINVISEIKITPNVRDYRLMCRQAVDAFVSLPERSRFNKGLFAWLGFKEFQIEQELKERYHGKSKWRFRKLLAFALDGITSFSSAPLKIWSYVGFFTALLAFLYGVFEIVKTLVFGIITPGYPSTLVVILFFSGLNMLSIGMLGEYIARVYIETKQRPLYIVRKKYVGSANEN
jgi:glycosyltransferase involved in cell wall biosynthesis